MPQRPRPPEPECQYGCRALNEEIRQPATKDITIDWAYRECDQCHQWFHYGKTPW